MKFFAHLIIEMCLHPRILKISSDIAFDYIIIDEEHNLLHKGNREILFASVVILLEKRNPNLIVKLLTLFAKDSKISRLNSPI